MKRAKWKIHTREIGDKQSRDEWMVMDRKPVDKVRDDGMNQCCKRGGNEEKEKEKL
jgi:hypothetical protein